MLVFYNIFFVMDRNKLNKLLSKNPDLKKDYKILLAAKKDSMEFLNNNQLQHNKHIQDLLDIHLL